MKTQLAAALLAVLIAAPCSAGSYSPAEIKKMFQQSSDTDDMRLRIQLRKKIFENSPDSAYGVASKAFLLTMADRLSPAQGVELYSRALALDPTIVVAHFNRASFYSTLGQKDKALEDYEAAIALGYKKPDAYVGLADAYKDLGQNEKALENYAKALAKDPGHAFAHNNRGALYSQRGEYDKAIADFNAALNTSTFAMAYMNRGDAYAGKKNYQKALSDYKAAEELIPDMPDVNIRRGRMYARLEDYDKAIAEYEAARRLDPRNLISLDLMGKAYYMAGNLEKAEEVYKRYMVEDPKDQMPHSNMSLIYERRRMPEQAAAELEKAVALAPQRADLKERLAKLQGKNGDAKGSEASLTALISTGTANLQMYYSRGEARLETGNYKGAEADFKLILKKTPDSPNTMIYLSLAMLRTGRRSEALELFSTVLDSDPARRSKLLKTSSESDPDRAAGKNVRAMLREMLKLYDGGAAGEPAQAADDRAAKSSALTQDDCYCVYYTGQIPPYFIAKVDQAPAGCKDIKFTAYPGKPGVSGLKSCSEFKKGV